MAWLLSLRAPMWVFSIYVKRLSSQLGRTNGDD